MTLMIWDSFALLVFQVPLYIAIVIMGVASGNEILRAGVGACIMMLGLGRPYGMWLDFVRRQFGLSGTGQKPMSLGG